MGISEDDAILCSVCDRVSARAEEVGFENLTRPEQVFDAIWWLEAEVNNGGFDQYMFNSAGDRCELVLDALAEVGAHATAEICREMYAMMPDGRPSTDRFTRQDQLELAHSTMGEEFGERCTALDHRFYDTEDDLRTLMVAYVHANNLVA